MHYRKKRVKYRSPKKVSTQNLFKDLNPKSHTVMSCSVGHLISPKATRKCFRSPSDTIKSIEPNKHLSIDITSSIKLF